MGTPLKGPSDTGVLPRSVPLPKGSCNGSYKGSHNGLFYKRSYKDSDKGSYETLHVLPGTATIRATWQKRRGLRSRQAGLYCTVFATPAKQSRLHAQHVF